jgi:BirA family biotin operon repressor/biotin-[acetyl-CoA-carboxylase] ligase
MNVAGVTPDLKWPNDLLVGDRKLAGVLAESLIESGEVAAVVVGLGLNVNGSGGLPRGAIALDEIAGRRLDRDALLDAVLDDLAVRLEQWEQDPVALHTAYRVALATIGRRVRVEMPGGAIVGSARDVDDDGRLLVDVGDGEVVVAAGDVIHLRPF